MPIATRRVLLITTGCCLAALAWWARGTLEPRLDAPPPAGGPFTSLAVLPFDCTPAATVSERALGVGLADRLTLGLRQMRGVRVTPFSQVLDASSVAAPSPRQIGGRLGVRAVLSGTCRTAPGRATLRLSLVDVASGVVLWEREASAEGTDPLELEHDLSDAVLEELARGEPPRAEAPPVAHYLCVLARAKITTMRSDAPAQALDLLEAALEQAPHLAEAHTELAAASVDVFLGGQSASPAWPARAVAAARRGVRLGPGEARAHFVLGRALLASGEPVEATRATLHALSLDPNLGMAHLQLAGILAGAGPVAPAKAAAAHAVRLDPAVSPGWVDSYLAQLEGRGDEQIALLRVEFERRRAAGEHLEQPAMLLAYLNASAGHSAEALSWLARLEGITHNDPMVDLIRMQVMSRLGRPEAVQRLLETHRPFYERDWQHCTWIAEAYAAAGRPDEALLWIEKAVELGSVDAWSIERMEGLSSLRGDPRLDAAARTLRQRVDTIMALVARTGYS